MKKFLVSAITAITVSTSAISTPVLADDYDNQQPNETVIKMFLMSQDMTDEQEDLTVAVVNQVKTLATAVKAPKQEVKDYLKGMAEHDYIDVEEVMAKYKAWQQNVDQEFEQSLIAVAELHASLTIEQRQKLMATFKKLSSH